MMEVVGLKKLDEKMGFEETELRLGLPGNKGGSATGTTTDQLGDINDEVVINRNKRGFSQTQEIQETDQTTTTTVDLMLNLSSNSKEPTDDTNKPNTLLPADPAKAQVVGWPPVRSYRKNMLAVQKSKEVESSEKNNINNISPNANGSFVKVSMDGAPYLRKVDLKLYNSYQHLSDSLANMFSSFTIGNCGSQGMKDFMNESRLMDLLNSSDYVPTYEDKDGDWMLVGDVPWEMFVDSCKRLRIMKGKEAIGLAPRAMEKFKNRS